MIIARVNNLPDYPMEEYVVARYDDNADLWFYGTYKTEDRAREVAIAINNGVVLRYVSDWNPAFGEKV